MEKKYKLSYLPQISIPYNIVIEKFDGENIPYTIKKVTPEEINPTQGITFSDNVNMVELGDKYPIYLDVDNNILDGHHRYVKAMMCNEPIIAIIINKNERDACRILNRIQDIYDYEENRGIEEVDLNSTINYYSDDENQFLNMMDEHNSEVHSENPEKNETKIVAYRKEPIKEHSVVGNFFILKPMNGYYRYEIEFDNLLDIEELGIVLKDSQNPSDVLAKIWFPNVNFDEIGKRNDIQPNNLKIKAIAEKAVKLGYDGIKYSDTLLQGLN